jgi:Na+/H+ antiporter NhaA
MSLFISGLSFDAGRLAELSKFGIIAASLISAIPGLMVLGIGIRRRKK